MYDLFIQNIIWRHKVTLTLVSLSLRHVVIDTNISMFAQFIDTSNQRDILVILVRCIYIISDTNVLGKIINLISNQRLQNSIVPGSILGIGYSFLTYDFVTMSAPAAMTDIYSISTIKIIIYAIVF